jgi:YhgE/Pip-like protein
MTLALLKKPLVWLFVGVAALMAFVMTFSYIGAFVDPAGNMHNMPLAIANEDAGATFGGQEVRYGDLVVERVLGPNSELGDGVKWTTVASREAALAGLRENKYYAALVIPADYSSRLISLAGAEAPADGYAEIEVLTNPASGSISGAEAQAIALAVVTRVSSAASEQIVSVLGGAAVSPARIRQLADPVRPTVTVGQPIGAKSARGLAPLYFAVMLTLGGYIGANIVHVGVEVAAGNLELDFLARRFGFRKMGAASRHLWLAKLVLVTAMAVLAGLLISWMAVGLLGMDASNEPGLVLFAILGTVAIANVTLLLLTAFGTAGLLLGVLFTTIFGVPSAGGVYPLEMLPGFFRFLATWLPLRYMTDGARSLIYYDGRGAAGLDTAVVVLLAYAVSAVLLGGVTAWAIDRVRAGGRAPATEPE